MLFLQKSKHGSRPAWADQVREVRTMIEITEHFTAEELQFSATGARLGLDNTCPSELIPNMRLVADRLELVRAHFGTPVRVLSCYRSPAVNVAVGGSRNSAHRYALAADFIIPGVPLVEIARWCADNIKDFDQIIYEFGSWVHMGFADKGPRRQMLTAIKVGGKTVYRTGLEVA